MTSADRVAQSIQTAQWLISLNILDGWREGEDKLTAARRECGDHGCPSPDTAQYLQYKSKYPQSTGTQWCACFVSAIGAWTEIKYPGDVKHIFNFASSQASDGNPKVWSTDITKAIPGVAISWVNTNGEHGGHIGYVIGVDQTKGLWIAEGNTSGGGTGRANSKNGGATRLKWWPWDKAANPTAYRRFNKYFLVWPDDGTLGKPLPNVAPIQRNIQPTLANNQGSSNNQQQNQQTSAPAELNFAGVMQALIDANNLINGTVTKASTESKVTEENPEIIGVSKPTLKQDTLTVDSATKSTNN